VAGRTHAFHAPAECLRTCAGGASVVSRALWKVLTGDPRGALQVASEVVRGAATVASKGNVGNLGRVPLTGKPPETRTV
jgi:hypothetical protein